MTGHIYLFLFIKFNYLWDPTYRKLCICNETTLLLLYFKKRISSFHYIRKNGEKVQISLFCGGFIVLLSIISGTHSLVFRQMLPLAGFSFYPGNSIYFNFLTRQTKMSYLVWERLYTKTCHTLHKQKNIQENLFICAQWKNSFIVTRPKRGENRGRIKFEKWVLSLCRSGVYRRLEHALGFLS